MTTDAPKPPRCAARYCHDDTRCRLDEGHDGLHSYGHDIDMESTLPVCGNCGKKAARCPCPARFARPLPTEPMRDPLVISLAIEWFGSGCGPGTRDAARAFGMDVPAAKPLPRGRDFPDPLQQRAVVSALHPTRCNLHAAPHPKCVVCTDANRAAELAPVASRPWSPCHGWEIDHGCPTCKAALAREVDRGAEDSGRIEDV